MKRLLQQDWAVAFAILIAGICYTLPFLNIPEFYRHTEADRTLIAWEMWERGAWFVPSLLGDLYITKPPLFYDALQISFRIFGEASEFSSRALSGFSAAVLLALQFSFARRLGWSTRQALLPVVFLGFSAQFFMYSVRAEMDMFYTLLCSATLFAQFFALQNRSANWAIAAWLFASLAFLSKGPPVLVFFGAGFIGGYLYLCLRREDLKQLALILLWQCLGGLLFLLLAGGWLLLVANEVGWETIQYQIENEFIRRFVSDENSAGRMKPWYFYLERIPSGLLPWSLTLLAVPFVFRRSTPSSIRNWKLDLWQSFALSACVLSVILFSISSGKSARYLFPLYPVFAVLLAQWTIFLSQADAVHRAFHFIVRSFAGLFLIAGIVAVIVSFQTISVLHDGVDMSLVSDNVFYSGASILIAALLTLLLLRRAKNKTVLSFCCACLLLFCVRIPFYSVFGNITTARKGLSHIATEIDQIVPPGEPVYFLELTERWIAYYLKVDSREVFRLNPSRQEALKNQQKQLYLVLYEQQEGWRFQELQEGGGTAQLLKRFATPKKDFLLVSLTPRDAALMELQEIFPVEESIVPERFRLQAPSPEKL